MENQASSAPIHLGDTEVHVWHVGLDDAVDIGSPRARMLSAEERGRAESFVMQIHRRRYLAAHLNLRHILSRYLGISPASVQLAESVTGKPELTPRSSLRFNMTHSRDRALYAVTRAREVGIDLEWVDSTVDVLGTARVLFFEPELAALEVVAVEERIATFFSVWTRKEAYVKATGRGLAVRLAEFDVAVAPGEPASLLAHPGDPAEINRWTFLDVPVRESFQAALVVETQDYPSTSTASASPLVMVHYRMGM